MTHQGQDQGDQVGGDIEAVERSVDAGHEGASTGLSAEAPIIKAIEADVAQPELAPCGAVGVVVGLVEWIYWVFY